MGRTYSRVENQAQTTRQFAVSSEETHEHLARLELLALWLDRRFIDPVLGFFIPGMGSSLGSLLGLYGVYVAMKIKVHPVVIARMLVNLSIDAVVGGIPFLGVVFDIFYRAHVRNLDLIKSRSTLAAPLLSDWLVVMGAGLILFLALLLPIILAGLLVTLLLTLFQR